MALIRSLAAKLHNFPGVHGPEYVAVFLEILRVKIVIGVILLIGVINKKERYKDRDGGRKWEKMKI